MCASNTVDRAFPRQRFDLETLSMQKIIKTLLPNPPKATCMQSNVTVINKSSSCERYKVQEEKGPNQKSVISKREIKSLFLSRRAAEKDKDGNFMIKAAKRWMADVTLMSAETACR